MEDTRLRTNPVDPIEAPHRPSMDVEPSSLITGERVIMSEKEALETADRVATMDEKSGYDGEKDDGLSTHSEEERIETDPFVPFPIEDQVQEDNILTVRAVLVGCCLGALVNASNVYLGKLEHIIENSARLEMKR